MSKKVRYIVVEGPIGVGKTTLAEMLAAKFDARLFLEKADENPFMAHFYSSMDKYAFQTQVFFLLSRWRQQDEIRQSDLFHEYTVSDYLFEKDRIFAELTLGVHEMQLYQQIYDQIVGSPVEPDLVVYLYASVDKLIRRVNKRSKNYESNMTPEYLEKVVEAYNTFFFNWRATPLLMVNTEQINFVDNPADFLELLNKIESIQGGVHHFTPHGSLPLRSKK